MHEFDIIKKVLSRAMQELDRLYIYASVGWSYVSAG